MGTRVGLLLLVPVLAGLAVAAHAATQATPRWQSVPNGAIDHRAVVQAADRFWLVDGPPGGGPVISRSARIGGAGLSAWKAVPLPAMKDQDYVATLGDELIITIGDDAQLGTEILRSMRLRSNGTLGDPVEPAGGPPEQSSDGALVARLPDRLIQAADAKPQTARYELGVCCYPDGTIVDLSALAPPNRPDQPPELGVDRKGRIWLSWSYAEHAKAPWTAWILQLDPATLQPIGKPRPVPGLRVFKVLDLVCTESCRLVFHGSVGRAKGGWHSWGPGESKVTPIKTPRPNGSLVAAHVHAGRLHVAYTATDPNGAIVLALARGDARGRKLVDRRALTVPEWIGASFATGRYRTVGPLGVFGPLGFGGFTVYEPNRGAHTVRAVVLPY